MCFLTMSTALLERWWLWYFSFSFLLHYAERNALRTRNPLMRRMSVASSSESEQPFLRPRWMLLNSQITNFRHTSTHFDTGARGERGKKLYAINHLGKLLHGDEVITQSILTNMIQAQGISHINAPTVNLAFYWQSSAVSRVNRLMRNP